MASDVRSYTCPANLWGYSLLLWELGGYPGENFLKFKFRIFLVGTLVLI